MKKNKIALITSLGAVLIAATGATGFSQTGRRPASAKPHGTPPVVHNKKECAASAVIGLGTDRFLVGGDEDNVLRLYSTADPNTVKASYPLAPVFKDVKEATIADKPKTDIEGAALFGNVGYFIGSHSMNTEGTEDKPERRRIFAIEKKETKEGMIFSRVGEPYAKLIEDLNGDPLYRDYHLDKAAKIGSKTAGGLSIEGLAQGEKDSLLIGFRNPIVKEKALIAVILNPREILDKKAPKFGPPIELNLGGLGIRDLTRSTERNSYFIIAGSFGAEDPTFRLYEWSGKATDAPHQVAAGQLDGLNPEAVAVFPAGDGKAVRLLILNDYEKSDVCAEKGFGAVWIDVK